MAVWLVPILFSLFFHTGSAEVTGIPFDDAIDTQTVNILERFGYLPPTPGGAGALRSGAGVSRALQDMQRFAGLKPTGLLDNDTRLLLKTPRCGMPDKQYGAPRVRRYALASSSWDKTHLTWKVTKYPSEWSREVREFSWDRTESILSRAFQVWSQSSSLTFENIPYRDTRGADIEVRFEQGNHGDGYNFDGPGSVLAHAFYPGNGIGGDAHFDDDEAWIEGAGTGTDFFTVAVHEIGHSLGLSHSRVQDAIMYPWYGGYKESFTRLHYDDMSGIYALYGAPNGKTLPPPPPTTSSTRGPDEPSRRPRPTKPDICWLDKIHAMGYMRGELFAFHGEWMWRYSEFGSLMGTSYPIQISNFFHGLPESEKGVDAIYESPVTYKLVLFRGVRFWVYDGNRLVPSFPKQGRSIRELGLPRYVRKVDAVFVWGHNGKTYIVSGGKYWMFNEYAGVIVRRGYPRSMETWRGIPTPVDSAFRNRDGYTYFLHERYVYRLDDERVRVARSWPRLHATELFGCSAEYAAQGYVNAADMQLPSPLASAADLRSAVGLALVLVVASWL